MLHIKSLEIVKKELANLQTQLKEARETLDEVDANNVQKQSIVMQKITDLLKSVATLEKLYKKLGGE